MPTQKAKATRFCLKRSVVSRRACIAVLTGLAVFAGLQLAAAALCEWVTPGAVDPDYRSRLARVEKGRAAEPEHTSTVVMLGSSRTYYALHAESLNEPLSRELRRPVSVVNFGFAGVGPVMELLTWRRLGLASFHSYEGMVFSGIDNKDASFFPVNIPNPTTGLELGLLHRPLFPANLSEESIALGAGRDTDLKSESIWISYSPTVLPKNEIQSIKSFTSLHRVAAPISPWESLKIGGGTPPILTKHGWLVVYHGVSEALQPNTGIEQLNYSAGVLMLSEKNPQVLLYRSQKPLLNPMPSQKARGTPANVVFPSGIDRRDDLGQKDRFDVYYGMDDFRIGVARLDIPDVLPVSATPDLVQRL